MVALLTDAGADGKPRFARDDVEDLLAFLILLTPPDGRSLDDDALALVGRFGARAGLRPGADDDAVRAAIAAYLEKKPLSDALIAALHALARDVLGGKAADDDVGRALKRFAGEAAAGGAVLGGGGPRPEGTVPAGPMARFHVDVKKK